MMKRKKVLGGWTVRSNAAAVLPFTMPKRIKIDLC